MADDWKKQIEGKTLTVSGIHYRIRAVERPDGSSTLTFDKIFDRGPRPQPVPRDPERIGNVPF